LECLIKGKEMGLRFSCNGQRERAKDSLPKDESREEVETAEQGIRVMRGLMLSCWAVKPKGYGRLWLILPRNPSRGWMLQRRYESGMRCSCTGYTESKSNNDSLLKDEIKEWMKQKCMDARVELLDEMFVAEVNAGMNPSQSWVKLLVNYVYCVQFMIL